MRSEILDATLDLIEAHGEAEATLSRVARAAGTTKPNVVHHFGTRAGLLAAVHARLLVELDAGLARLAEDFPEPRARLEAFAEALFSEPGEGEPARALHVLAFHLAREPARTSRLRAFLDELFREGARVGAWRPVRRPRLVADALLSAAQGAQALWAGGDDLDTERVGRWVVDVVVRVEVYGESPSPRAGRRRLPL